MAGIKDELVKMLNAALELEHSARIQYLAHAELVEGINADPLIERLTEIAGDEQKHEEMFRNLVGTILLGEPSMALAPTHRATDIKEILEVNLKGEKDAIEYYRKIYRKVVDNKDALVYEFEKLEHEIRHVIIDEQEHVAELSTLLGK